MKAALLAAIALAGCAAAPPPSPVRGDGGWISAPPAEELASVGGVDAAAVRPVVAPTDERQCGQTESGFEGWLEAYRRGALARGASASAVAALADVAYDARVIELDRSQRAFKLSLAAFTAKHLTAARLARGKQLLRAHGPVLADIEARFGVQPQVLVAIWGLETDYGANTGTTSSLRALATLAYDCRRAARFRDELASALRIVARGDLAPDAMLGAWAGELGQTQFLPSSYEKFAIDFDGDGRADLIGSPVDALASTANYLQGHGWRAKEAFAPGTPNFEALGSWNASEVYRRAIVVFAGRLAGP